MQTANGHSMEYHQYDDNVAIGQRFSFCFFAFFEATTNPGELYDLRLPLSSDSTYNFDNEIRQARHVLLLNTSMKALQ